MRKTTNKYSPEVRERAVRMVADNAGQHESRWSAILSISSKIGCAPQTLNEWVKKAEVDRGDRAGITTEMAEKMKALERENRELKQANEILRKASAYFAQAELDRRSRTLSPSSKSTVTPSGSSRSANTCRLPRRRSTITWPGGRTPTFCRIGRGGI